MIKKIKKELGGPKFLLKLYTVHESCIRIKTNHSKKFAFLAKLRVTIANDNDIIILA